MQQKSKKIIYLLPVLVFVLVVVFLYFQLRNTENKAESSSALINKTVPAFSFPLLVDIADFDQNNLVTNANLPTTPYLLNVWGSWCVACSREHHMLQEMSEAGVTIIGINYKDEVEYANDFLNDNGNPFTMVVFDEMGDMGVDLGLTGAPESFMVDNKGIVRQHIVGEITKEIWMQRIQPCHQALMNNADDNKITEVCK